MPTLELPIPLIESGKAYAPGSLMRRLVGFVRTPEGTIRTIRGGCPLVPDYGSGYPAQYGRMHGVFHVRLRRGQRDVMLIRTGETLCQQAGWEKTVKTLQSGLSDEQNQRFADQFCVVNDKVIWTNGVDRARVFDGYVDLPLGYDEVPSAPIPRGPASDGHPAFTNRGGYAHPGRVGTVGEIVSDNDGTLLPFARYYAVQYEDHFGNRSALSALSAPVQLRTERSSGLYWDDYANYPSSLFLGFPSHTGQALGLLSVTMDDLTKQFFVDEISVGPAGTRKRIVYASANAITEGSTPRKMVEIPDNITTSIPDNFPDSELGPEADEPIQVPVFGVMCAHQGGLAIAVGPRVYLSERGTTGTFFKRRYVEPDPAGGDITGLASWAGKLIACTETSIYAVVDDAEGLRHQPVSPAQGNIAPGALRPTGFGTLMGLGRDGFWQMDAEGKLLADVSEDLSEALRRVDWSRASRATSCWRSRTREYICALPLAGDRTTSLLVLYDGTGWKEWEWSGLTVRSICETQDWTRRLLVAGSRSDTGEHNVWVLDAEHAEYDFLGKTNLARTQWLKPDVFGRKRFTAARIFIGIRETGAAKFTLRVYKNYRQDRQVGGDRSFAGYAPDLDRLKEAGEGTAAALADVVVGTDAVRLPRMTWKRADVHLAGVESFSFDLTCEDPTRMEIHAIAFEFDTEDSGESVSTE